MACCDGALLSSLCSKEAAYILDSYRRSGHTQVWLDYKNSNGTYLTDNKIVPKSKYMLPWSKEHTGEYHYRRYKRKKIKIIFHLLKHYSFFEVLLCELKLIHKQKSPVSIYKYSSIL